MLISRNSTAAGGDNSSSYSITIAGDIIIAFITYDNGQTLNTITLNGVSGTVKQTTNNTSEGYKISAVSFIGTFSGSQAISMTWTGGTPTNIRAVYLGYNGSNFIDSSNQLSDTGGTVSATVITNNCWVVGYTGVAIASGPTSPSTGTNNDGYYATTGTSNGLLRNVIGDSNATVSTGVQSVVTTTGGGYIFSKIIIVLGETVYPFSPFPSHRNS